jgi:hypothetical protein
MVAMVYVLTNKGVHKTSRSLSISRGLIIYGVSLLDFCWIFVDSCPTYFALYALHIGTYLRY